MGLFEIIFDTFALVSVRQMKPGFLHNKRDGSVLPSASFDKNISRIFKALNNEMCTMLGGSLGEVRGIFSGG